jgi:Arc/MetJ-type ribon-helix-helix transcriptional regulator
MVQMTRKQVYLRRDQEEGLKSLAGARHASESELIREAIDHLLAEHADDQRRARWLAHLEWVKHRAATIPGGTEKDRGWTRDDLHERASGL